MNNFYQKDTWTKELKNQFANSQIKKKNNWIPNLIKYSKTEYQKKNWNNNKSSFFKERNNFNLIKNIKKNSIYKIIKQDKNFFRYSIYNFLNFDKNLQVWDKSIKFKKKSFLNEKNNFKFLDIKSIQFQKIKLLWQIKKVSNFFFNSVVLKKIFINSLNSIRFLKECWVKRLSLKNNIYLKSACYRLQDFRFFNVPKKEDNFKQLTVNLNKNFEKKNFEKNFWILKYFWKKLKKNIKQFFSFFKNLLNFFFKFYNFSLNFLTCYKKYNMFWQILKTFIYKNIKTRFLKPYFFFNKTSFFYNFLQFISLNLKFKNYFKFLNSSQYITNKTTFFKISNLKKFKKRKKMKKWKWYKKNK